MLNLIPVQWRVAALGAALVMALTLGFGAGWTANGWRLGKAQAEADYTAAAAALDTLTARANAAAVRAAGLKTSLDTLNTAATTARREIANVLPPDNRACDLPASARRLFNHASGYPDDLPRLGAAHP